VTSLGGDQIIPRPPGSVPGGPAPWASLDPQRRRGLSIERVVAALELHTDSGDRAPASATTDAAPGAGAAAAPVSVLPDLLLEGERIPSAVLVAMFEQSGETRVILTRRSKALRLHQGEVSFPGGRCDRGESPTECALREAHEETGLDPSTVSVVGCLSPLTTFSSQSFVTPVVGVLGGRPRLQANPGEVDRVFDVELAELASDGTFREERWRLADRPGSTERPAATETGGPEGWYPVWFFELPGDTVWGATARILVELLEAVL